MAQTEQQQIVTATVIEEDDGIEWLDDPLLASEIETPIKDDDDPETPYIIPEFTTQNRRQGGRVPAAKLNATIAAKQYRIKKITGRGPRGRVRFLVPLDAPTRVKKCK